ncbi:MAG TPA: hypothetical protein VKX49_22290 [Bryobacteraceae bacterium]|nr:hypothetical protein [Bryobacteraceae bacterium]
MKSQPPRRAPRDPRSAAATKPRPATLKTTESKEHRSRATRHFLAALGLCLLALVAYLNSFSAGFVLDNKALILNDPRIRDASAANVNLILQHSYWWPTGESGLYRPLATLSYLFNYSILGNGDRPAGYHWINISLHAAAVLLLFAVLLRLVGQFWPSVFIAALWAVHPASTESVTNIVGRADLLAAIGVLSGFLLYLKSTDTSGWRRAVSLAGLATATAIGVFSKESAVSIAGIIVLYELVWWQERRERSGRVWAFAAVLVPIALMLVMRYGVLANSPPADWPFTDNPIVGAGFWTGRLTALKVMAQYLWLAVSPMRLSSDYSYSQIPLASGSIADWIAWLNVAAAGLAAMFLYRWNRAAFFFAGFAAIAFLPTSNLLFPIGTVMADRFLYLPLAGFLACLVLCACQMLPHGRARVFAPVAVSLVIAGFAIRTWTRNTDWQNDLALSTADIRSSPNSFKLHALRAAALLEADPSHANIDCVIQEADRSVAILDPLPDLRNAPNVYQSAGEDYLIKGDVAQKNGSGASLAAYRRARELLGRSIRINNAYQQRLAADHGGSHLAVVPRSLPAAYNQLSAVDLRLGDREGALIAANQARALAPLEPLVYRQLASVFLAHHRGQEAVNALMEGLLITFDPATRADLIQLFSSNDQLRACALIPGPAGPAINPRCQAVQDAMCAASADVLKVRIQSGRRDLAIKDKQNFLRDYGCPAEPLNRILP